MKEVKNKASLPSQEDLKAITDQVAEEVIYTAKLRRRCYNKAFQDILDRLLGDIQNERTDQAIARIQKLRRFEVQRLRPERRVPQ